LSICRNGFAACKRRSVSRETLARNRRPFPDRHDRRTCARLSPGGNKAKACMAGGPMCEFRVGWTAGAAIIKVRSACQQGVWQEAIRESGRVRKCRRQCGSEPRCLSDLSRCGQAGLSALAPHTEMGQALYRRFTEYQVQDTIVGIRSQPFLTGFTACESARFLRARDC
jgi:hypothetical protein